MPAGIFAQRSFVLREDALSPDRLDDAVKRSAFSRRVYMTMRWNDRTYQTRKGVGADRCLYDRRV